MAKSRYFSLTVKIPNGVSVWKEDITRFVTLIRNTIGSRITEAKFCVQHFCTQNLPNVPATIMVRCNLATADNGIYYGNDLNNPVEYNDIILIENLKAGYNYDGPSAEEWYYCSNILSQSQLSLSFLDATEAPFPLGGATNAHMTLRFKISYEE